MKFKIRLLNKNAIKRPEERVKEMFHNTGKIFKETKIEKSDVENQSKMSSIWPLENRKNSGKENGKEVMERASGGFPGGAVVESLPANAGNTGSSPGLGGSHMPRSD